MRIVRAHSRSGVSFTRSRDERALQSLAGLIWETVARVANGHTPDAEDRAVVQSAQVALIGQRDMIEYVTKRAASPAPVTALRGTDTLVDLIWIAAEQLDVHELLSVPRSEGITVLVETLRAVGEGDVETARRWDALFGRVAVLVESSGNGAALSF